MPANARLARALAVSAALHLLLAAAWQLTLAPLPRRSLPPTTLTVELVRRDGEAPTQPLPPAAAVPPPLTHASRQAGELTRPARFVVAPDMSLLEEYPVARPGSVTLRLRISAAGTIEDIQIRRADPAPTALIEGMTGALRRARLEPAYSDQRPVASELDIVIRYEPNRLAPADPAAGTAAALPAQ